MPQRRQASPVVPNKMPQAKSRAPTRRQRKRAAPMASYKGQFLGGLGHKRAVQIQMSPLKPSAERRARSVL